MKKVFALIVAATLCIAANAQFYVGGSLSFQTNDATTAFEFAPEAGYALNETFSVGAVLDFDTQKDFYTQFTITPYIRWNAMDFEPLKLFVDGGIAISSYKNKVWDTSATGFELVIRPGFAIPINEQLSFVTHVGYLGFGSNEDGAPGILDGFGLGVSGNNILCGLYYSF